MEQLDKIKVLTGESNEELLSLLLEMSEDRILAITNRTILPDKLKQAQLDWSVIIYNRLGMEGENSRTEGAISSSFTEIPESIQRAIKSNTLGRIGGMTYEKTL